MDATHNVRIQQNAAKHQFAGVTDIKLFSLEVCRGYGHTRPVRGIF
jgi:hypothetical protein